MATPPQKSAQVRTRRALLDLLKQEGPSDSQTLAARLGISAMAVRQHLYALQDEHLVAYEEEPRAMGRPAKQWRLTPDANRFFPSGYADLTLGLLQSIVEAFGEAGLDQLLAVRSHRQIEQYQAQLAPQPSLAQKLESLAQVRTEEGYMAEVTPHSDGSYLLIENHCPICIAAAACTGLCDRELEIFQTVLGENVVVARTEHIIAGARRCAYQVEPRHE